MIVAFIVEFPVMILMTILTILTVGIWVVLTVMQTFRNTRLHDLSAAV